MEKKFITDDDCYLFGKGSHYEIFEKLGAHVMTVDGVKGTYFAVWAPHAKSVSVVGDFNDWIGYNHNMEMNNPSGIWELFIPEVTEGSLYKYVIVTQNGDALYKADPYGFWAEKRPGNASRIADISGYKWGDKKWIDEKKNSNHYEKPMSIYEVHPGSWRKEYKGEGDEDGFYDYRRLADELVAYVKDMGYTHVELMGISEYPFDGSWGYQVVGYYAPTSRYGEPKDFMYLVDTLHKNGIGIILDWVPAHFPRDAHGLAMFDGTPLYEYADTRKGEHPDWGTKVFDYSKTEVSNFLIANAMFWVEKYHIDGLRVDAVASMLYLDYGRRDGQWCPNKYGGNENLEAIEFFKHLSSIMLQKHPEVYIIAEESTAWPKVTYAPEEGGLGFSYKWNMGWMHDFLDYVKLDPYFKKFNHNKMTFGITYAFSEDFILVLSHDEVVHLKCSMLNKMPGLTGDKFKNLKTAYTFMFGHPGRKLLFMGQEFAQLNEWSEKRSLDWYLLDEPEHKDVQEYVKKLLHIYKKYPALYTETKGYDAFEWINADDCDRSIFSFIRKTGEEDYNNAVGCVYNFTPMERPDYLCGVPKAGTYKRIITTESGDTKEVKYKAEPGECDGFPYRISIPLRPFEAVMFEFPKAVKKSNTKKKDVKKTSTKKNDAKKTGAKKAK
ncbi:MAG: 1,4-alpha-glucan branching protein GlgB [Lachnospiraceae bacterium]|nr:1,4-alpha-glucan branching protein GlgB [Lachnospiraceae bacterium]